MILIGFIIYWIACCFTVKEGWSQQTIDDFNEYQNFSDVKVKYNMDILQKQVSEKDVKYLIKNRHWKWSDNIKKIYLDSISKNKILNVDPQASLNYAQSIYTEPAVKQTLSFSDETVEGQFLLDGVHDQSGSVFKCIDGKMKQIDFAGYDKFYGNVLTTQQNIKNADIPRKIAGFKFIKGECNPCSALNNNYSCPFSFFEERKNVKEQQEESELGDYTGSSSTGSSAIWKFLWGLPVDYSSLKLPVYDRVANMN
jgi:hypothetical protein